MTDEHGSPQHKPGPWRVEVGENPWEGGLAFGVFAGEETVVSPDSTGCVLLATEADARLIAAAPELLEALRELIYDGGDGHWYAGIREDWPVDEWGAVLLKAEGKVDEPPEPLDYAPCRKCGAPLDDAEHMDGDGLCVLCQEGRV